LKKLALDYYREGRNYETLIRRAFNCKKGKKYGADQEVFIALFKLDTSKKTYGRFTIYELQFKKVKLNIEKALIKLTKRKRYYRSYDHFIPLLLKLHKASTPQHLVKIINITLLKIIKLENELKNGIRNKDSISI
jgi:hypothetical protein